MANKNIEKIIGFIKYAEKLKVELRAAFKSNKTRESVADHSWRVTLILLLIVPKLSIKVDFLKILKMAIIHDLVEIEAKDTPVLDLIISKDLQSKKRDLEIAAMQRIKEMLGEDSREIYDLWVEYEEQKTNEAKVLKVVDMLEGQTQFLSEDVTDFSKFDQSSLKKLLEETTELSKIDSFLEQFDKETLEGRKNRINE